MFSIAWVIVLFLGATALAVMEASSEGRKGGAKDFPSWRLNPNSPLGRIISRIMPSDFITSYHLSLLFLLLILFHLLFLVKGGVTWSIAGELELLSFFFLFITAEDILWFVWNRYYGIRRFRPQFAVWHKRWIGPFPLIVIIWFTGSLTCSLLSSIFGGFDIIRNWGMSVGIYSGLMLFSIFLSEAVIKREDPLTDMEQT